MNKDTLEQIISAIKQGSVPAFPLDVFPFFSEDAAAGNEHLGPAALKAITDSLSAADVQVLERALQAQEAGELAWLGFKIVYDAAAAQANTDNEVTKKYGDQGSANGESFLFFCNDNKDIVSAHEYSPRDAFQMKDVTRGPSMHNQQFDGVT